MASQHAYASEHLLPYLHPGAKVLDVGSGSGYLSAVLHHLVGPTGKVVGIDHIPELVDWSVENLKKDGLSEALEKKQIEMITGDGRQGMVCFTVENLMQTHFIVGYASGGASLSV
jgi:protein-L-isoaspartate(D-aspartate) O-methyltransferase